MSLGRDEEMDPMIGKRGEERKEEKIGMRKGGDEDRKKNG